MMSWFFCRPCIEPWHCKFASIRSLLQSKSGPEKVRQAQTASVRHKLLQGPGAQIRRSQPDTIPRPIIQCRAQLLAQSGKRQPSASSSGPEGTRDDMTPIVVLSSAFSPSTTRLLRALADLYRWRFLESCGSWPPRKSKYSKTVYRPTCKRAGSDSMRSKRPTPLGSDAQHRKVSGYIGH